MASRCPSEASLTGKGNCSLPGACRCDLPTGTRGHHATPRLINSAPGARAATRRARRPRESLPRDSSWPGKRTKYLSRVRATGSSGVGTGARRGRARRRRHGDGMRMRSARHPRRLWSEAGDRARPRRRVARAPRRETRRVHRFGSVASGREPKGNGQIARAAAHSARGAAECRVRARLHARRVHRRGGQIDRCGFWASEPKAFRDAAGVPGSCRGGRHSLGWCLLLLPAQNKSERRKRMWPSHRVARREMTVRGASRLLPKKSPSELSQYDRIGGHFVATVTRGAR